VLVEAEEVVDPNKDKMAAASAKRDADAEADLEQYEKANVWDAGRDAPTMKALMNFNKARCIETFDEKGVSSKVGEQGMTGNLFDQMNRQDEMSESSSDIGVPVTPLEVERPKTALGLRNVWTPSPATKRRIKPIRRMMSAHSGPSPSQRSQPSTPGPSATRYEIERANKSKSKSEARNMTPEGYRPASMFNTLMSRKEGAAEKFADAFVPNPYVSDSERIKRETKVNAARWVGSAFLTASGARPMRKINYASDPYTTFSFDRPICKEKWMRDQDFTKMGRTLQPFDPALKEPKKPPRRRPNSRA